MSLYGIKIYNYVGTYETLEKAQLAQKEFKQKTIILASW